MAGARGPSREDSPDPLSVTPDAELPSPKKMANRLDDLSSARYSSKASRTQVVFDTPDFNEPSPSKSFVMHTGGVRGSSPWKIKVTVEAEPDEGEGTPTRPTKSRTVTTKVPLKDADTTSPLKRRGRPRKSDGAASPKQKRDVTPARKPARKSLERQKSDKALRRRRQSFGVVNSIDDESGLLDKDNDVTTDVANPEKPKRRGRRSMYPLTEEDEAKLIRLKRSNFRWEEIGDQFPNHPLSTLQHRWYSKLQHEFEKTSERGPEQILQSQEKNGTAVDESDRRSNEITDEDQNNEAPDDEPTDVISDVTGTVQHDTSPSDNPSINNTIPEISLNSTENNIPSRQEPTGSQEKRPQNTQRRGFDFTKLTPLHKKYSFPTQTSAGTPDPTLNPISARVPTPRRPSGWEDRQSTSLEQEEIILIEDEDTVDPSILESEGFSIVSLDSLKAALSSPHQSILKAVSEMGDQHDISKAIDAVQSNAQPSDKSSSPSIAKNSLVTPFGDYLASSIPPPIEPQAISPSKTATPRLARVVKAGIALQGVVHVDSGVSATGSPEQSKSQQQKTRLDGLFSAFGEGTRRELSAGLRLGEELARRSHSRQTSRSTSPVVLVENKNNDAIADDDVFQVSSAGTTTTSNSQRLPTPVETMERASGSPLSLRRADETYALTMPPTESADVEYPSLTSRTQHVHLASPESDDEMDWQADTPPSNGESASELEHEITPNPLLTPQQQRTVQHAERLMQTHSAQAKKQLTADAYRHRGPRSSAGHSSVLRPMPSSPPVADVWEEEGSRESVDVSTLNDASAATGIRPADGNSLSHGSIRRPPRRAKIPQTWRRRSSSDFSYSDEPEVDEPEAVPEEKNEDDEDSGIYWQNRRAAFKKPVIPKRRADPVDLTELLGLNDTTLPESIVFDAPAASAQNAIPKSNSPVKTGIMGPPIKPPMSSPSKPVVSLKEYPNTNSGVENELSTFSTASSVGQSRVEPDTSLFNDTEASDVRQLRSEMRFHVNSLEPVNSSTQKVQTTHRSLQDSLSAFDQKSGLSVSQLDESEVEESQIESSLDESVNATVASLPVFNPLKQPPNLFSRLWSSTERQRQQVDQPEPQRKESRVQPTIPSVEQDTHQHPLVTQYPALPYLHPWTKSHYKVLDSLYQIYKRTPATFSPALPSNSSLLSIYPSLTSKHLNSKYSNWGYTVRIKEPHLILCAIFLQCCTVRDAAEYKRVNGSDIVVGDVGPTRGKDGYKIDEKDVVSRVFSVIAGERVRKDEKKGKEIDRTTKLEVVYGDGSTA